MPKSPARGAAAKTSRKTARRTKSPGASGTRAQTPATPHDGETEQRILAAARTVFIRDGTSGARMQEIAREAGVNQALLHYYFRSKQRLSDAVFQQVAAGLFPALVVTLGSDAPLGEKIERLVDLYLDVLARSPFLPGYLLSEMHHHPERIRQLVASAGLNPVDVLPHLLEKLRGQIEREVRAGTMRPIAPEQLVINLIALCVFPFAARPMLSIALGMDDGEFARFTEQRKTDVTAFVRNALRP